MNILVTGPESTGKSTISQFIADEFDAELIPEYARSYLEINGKDYRQEDLIIIAKQHYELHKKIKHAELRVYDTFLLNIKVWSDFKYGSSDPWIVDHYTNVNFDLVLLATPDVSWIDDPLRENPHNRQELFMIFKKELEAISQTYVVLDSDLRSRQKQVKRIITSLAEESSS